MFLLTALVLVVIALVHSARSGRRLDGRLELVLDQTNSGDAAAAP